jgi:hypothetical protein
MMEGRERDITPFC